MQSDDVCVYDTTMRGGADFRVAISASLTGGVFAETIAHIISQTTLSACLERGTASLLDPNKRLGTTRDLNPGSTPLKFIFDCLSLV